MGIADCRQSSTLVSVAFCVSALCLIASAATNDDSWRNLNHVTRDHYYTFMDRKSNCVTGYILNVTDHSVTIKLSDATIETLDRTNILRVSVSQAAPYFPHNVQADVGRVRDIIYNDKSSWSDVKVLAPLERLHIEGQTVRIVRRGVHDIEGKLTPILGQWPGS
jgi:hypothetical protein